MLDVFVSIFNHDNGSINHGADGDGNATQTHNVGVDPLSFHDDEADQYANRQGDNTHQGATKMK